MKKSADISVRIFLCCWIISSVLFEFSANGQEARIEKKEELTIIYNPKTPVKRADHPSSLVLKKDLTIGEDFNDINSSFSNIGSVFADVEEDIIVIDDKESIIKVFDKTGKHLRTFGKRGQGPGEFQNAGRIVLKGGRDIVVLDRGNNRFSYYSKEGRCLREIKFGKYTAIRRVKVDSNGYIYSDTVVRDGNTVKDEIIACNSLYIFEWLISIPPLITL